jgi:iron complex outermembrane receptor protein
LNGDRYHVYSAINDPNRINDTSGELHFDVKFNGFDFQSITNASQTKAVTHLDADGTSATITDLVNGPETSTDYSQEFRLLSNNDSKWQWLGGAFGFYGKDEFDSALNVGIGALGSAGQQTVETSGGAVFGDLSYKFSDQWTLKAGGRWSYEKKKVNLISSEIAPVPFAPVPYHDEADWSDFTPSVILEYRPGIGLLYAKYSEGFKSGGFNYPAGTGNPVLKPEKLKSYEVGYKADLMDNRLRFDASVYYYDFKDLQVLIASENTDTVTVTTQNAAGAKVKGAELNLTWIPVDRLSIQPGVSYTDGYYSSYPAASGHIPNPLGLGYIPNSFDAAGYPLLNSPKWTVFTQLGYEFQVFNEKFPTSLTYSWKDSFDQDFVIDPSEAALRQHSYALLNARMAYLPSRMPNLQVALWGNNLTNKAYFNLAFINATGVTQGYAPPRTWGVDLKYSF